MLGGFFWRMGEVQEIQLDFLRMAADEGWVQATALRIGNPGAARCLWDGRARRPGRREGRLRGLEADMWREQRCPSSVFLGAPGGAERIVRRSPKSVR